MISDVLLHKSCHVLVLDSGVTKEGWHFLEIVVKMVRHMEIDLQKSEKGYRPKRPQGWWILK